MRHYKFPLLSQIASDRIAFIVCKHIQRVNVLDGVWLIIRHLLFYQFLVYGMRAKGIFMHVTKNGDHFIVSGK